MPIVVVAITVAVRCDAIEGKVGEGYPGGLQGFENDAPNDTFSTDGELASCSFMSPQDAGDFINTIQSKSGLKFLVGEDNQAQDIVVVDQRQGPCNKCDWIHFGTQVIGDKVISFCWIGSNEVAGRELKGPSWWTPEHNSNDMTFIPQEMIDNGAVVFREDQEEE
jgi:hypothetical protein